MKLKQDNVWCDVDLQNSSILEIQFPVDSLSVKPKLTENSLLSHFKIKDELILECSQECTAQLLALAVDHVDVLLEDWYPTLGTRFVHTSEGKFLITRLIPCPHCMGHSQEDFDSNHPSTSHDLDETSQNYHMYRTRKSQESWTSECDSGVDPDSNVSSRNVSTEGHPNLHGEDQTNPVYYSWLVEECILESYNDKVVSCPTHGEVKLTRIAPDVVSVLEVHLVFKWETFLSLGISGFGRSLHNKTRKH